MTDCALLYDMPASKFANDWTFLQFYFRLKEIAISEFEWIGLPNTCDERFLELNLFDLGYGLFFEDLDTGAFFTLKASFESRFNIYHIPIYRRAISITGKTWECDDLNSVLVYNNRLRIPSSSVILDFAERLYRIQRSIDQNVDAMRTPYILTGAKSQERVIKEMYKKVSEFDGAIYTDKDAPITKQIEVLNLNPPEYYAKLDVHFQRVWNQALTYLGLNNTNYEKRETQTEDEINANNAEVEASRLSRLIARKDACKKINELWPELNVDVRIREERLRHEQIYHDNAESDGGDNGTDTER